MPVPVSTSGSVPATCWPDEFLLPRHGATTLAQLVPAIGSHLTSGRADPGSADPDTAGMELFDQDPFGLPEARRYVVLLVDGMGEQLLDRHRRLAPQLDSLERCPVPVTCAVPSTTATSLSCLGTGSQPGCHGIMGYTFRSPVGGRMMNALSWQGGDDPAVVQPHRTAFQRLAGAGVAVTSVGPRRFEGSGLTRASLRGPQFLGVDDEEDIDLRVELAGQGSGTGERSLCYVYERSLDHVGHGRGCESSAWSRRLSWVDELVQALCEGLEPGTVLVVTADHGMIDVPAAHRLVVEDEPQLTAEVDDIGGEPRFRQIYTRNPLEVARSWTEILADRAVVLTADRAIEQGLFGAWDPTLRNRVGDVLVAMRSDWAVMTRRAPQELGLVGMHGSLSRAEMAIPMRWQMVGTPTW